MAALWIWIVMHSGLHVELACAGTSGQRPQPQACDGFAVIGESLVPLWQAQVAP